MPAAAGDRREGQVVDHALGRRGLHLSCATKRKSGVAGLLEPEACSVPSTTRSDVGEGVDSVLAIPRSTWASDRTGDDRSDNDWLTEEVKLLTPRALAALRAKPVPPTLPLPRMPDLREVMSTGCSRMDKEDDSAQCSSRTTGTCQAAAGVFSSSSATESPRSTCSLPVPDPLQATCASLGSQSWQWSSSADDSSQWLASPMSTAPGSWGSGHRRLNDVDGNAGREAHDSAIAGQLGSSVSRWAGTVYSRRQLMDSVADAFRQVVEESAAFEAPRPLSARGGRVDSLAIIGHGCLCAHMVENLARLCEVIGSELLPEERVVWHSFLEADLKLKGRFSKHDKSLRTLISEFARVPMEVAEEIISRPWRHRVGDNELDFADVLACAREAKKHQQDEGLWDSFVGMFASGRPRPSEAADLAFGLTRIGELQLRARCSQMSHANLTAALRAYRRTLSRTCWFRCEWFLLEHVLPQSLKEYMGADEGFGENHEDGGVPAQAGACKLALTSMLRGFQSELLPTERILWELLTEKKQFLSDRYTMEDVREAMESLHCNTLIFSALKDAEHVAESRACGPRERLVRELFSSCSNVAQTVSFSEIVQWWWAIPDAERAAAGLVVSASRLRRCLELEKGCAWPVDCTSYSPALANATLGLLVRVCADLRAMGTRNTLRTFTRHISSASSASSAAI